MKIIRGTREFVNINYRKWTPHKEQATFEKLLEENGFIIDGIKEAMSKAEYIVTKDGVQEEFSFNIDDKADTKIVVCLRSHEILLENIKLKQELARRNKL